VSVTDISQAKFERGEPAFLCCPCGTDEGWAVQCLKTQRGPVIAALVCMGCERVMLVENGFPSPEKP